MWSKSSSRIVSGTRTVFPTDWHRCRDGRETNLLEAVVDGGRPVVVPDDVKLVGGLVLPVVI
jgi:hypothetical protein